MPSAASQHHIIDDAAALAPTFDVFPDYDWAASLELPLDFEQVISDLTSDNNPLSEGLSGQDIRPFLQP